MTALPRTSLVRRLLSSVSLASGSTLLEDVKVSLTRILSTRLSNESIDSARLTNEARAYTPHDTSRNLAGFATGWNAISHRQCHVDSGPVQEAGQLPSKAENSGSDKDIVKKYTTIKAELIEGGSVGLIYLDRPKALNALSDASMIEVIDACQSFDGLEKVGAIVITGSGKAFAAGADIKEMKDKSFEKAYNSRIFSHWNSLTAISKPLIGAINGFALGGGCELALMCDILLAGEKAVFGQPEVNLGVIPGMGGTQRLIREVGKSRAMEMILTGKAFLNADEAVRTGLVSRVIPGGNEELLNEAIAVAKSISKLSRPSVAMAKEAVNTAYEVGLQEGIKREHSLFCGTFALQDQKEGMSAFIEKRAPNFKNK